MRINGLKRESLSKDENIYIKHCIDIFFEGLNEQNSDIIKITYFKKHRKILNVNNINENLLKYRTIPTLYGIWHIYPEHRIFQTIHNILQVIREILLDEPSTREFTEQKIKIRTKEKFKDIEFALRLLFETNRFFGSASGTQKSKVGYESVTIRSNEGIDNILKYENIQSLITECISQSTLKRGQNLEDDGAIKITRDTEQSVLLKNTAFILMQINPNDPTLVDIHKAFKEIFIKFSIKAIRADEIEHQETITEKIIEKIRTSEFLIADLSGERPNVYYEVGYSHALGKRPILYRKKGTKLHFDLSVHNVPEYDNITDLKEKLTKRLEEIMGRKLETEV